MNKGQPNWRVISQTAALTLLFWIPSLAFAETSPNYRIDSNQVGPNQFRQTSTNYIIDGSTEGIVGLSESAAFDNEQGSPLRIDATETSNPGTREGPSHMFSPPLDFTVDTTCNRAYKNLLTLKGTRHPEVSFVFVNNAIAGVSFPTPTTWIKTVWLQAGINHMEAYGQDDDGRISPKILFDLQLLRMGDVNMDGKTDDYDLSLLSRKWQARKDCSTDFNRDTYTDDYDLSLLATSWSK